MKAATVCAPIILRHVEGAASAGRRAGPTMIVRWYQRLSDPGQARLCVHAVGCAVAAFQLTHLVRVRTTWPPVQRAPALPAAGAGRGGRGMSTYIIIVVVIIVVGNGLTPSIDPLIEHRRHHQVSRVKSRLFT